MLYLFRSFEIATDKFSLECDVYKVWPGWKISV